MSIEILIHADLRLAIIVLSCKCLNKNLNHKKKVSRIMMQKGVPQGPYAIAKATVVHLPASVIPVMFTASFSRDLTAVEPSPEA